MVPISIIFRSRRWLKRGFLLASWILSFLILINFSGNNELNALYNDSTGHKVELKVLKNQIRTLSYTRYDPTENSKPVYSVSFKNLLVENNKVGIFKTALHKVVKIRDLELTFYEYAPSKVSAGAIPDIYSGPKGATSDEVAFVKNILHKLTTPKDGWRVNRIDLGNVSEVRVNDFDYKVFYDDDFFFGIRSKRAMVSYKHAGIVLRGHVTIKTADGSTLESNYVKWDVKRQHFTVNGVYVLNRDGIQTMGKNINIDAQLNNAVIKRAKFERKEEQKCFAKL